MISALASALSLIGFRTWHLSGNMYALCFRLRVIVLCSNKLKMQRAFNYLLFPDWIAFALIIYRTDEP